MKTTGFTSPQMFKQDKDIENKLKQSYVTLGDSDLQGAFFSSTQKTFFNEKGKGEREATVQNNDKTNASNFSIGGSNNQIQKTSAQTEQFIHSPAAKNMQAPTDFVKLLKANHFEIRHNSSAKDAPQDPLAHYKTLHQNYFKTPPPDQDKSRFSIAAERKQELIKAHFDIGSPTVRAQNNPNISASKSFFNHPQAQPASRAPNLFNTAGTLKHQSVNVHNGGPAAHPGQHYFSTNT